MNKLLIGLLAIVILVALAACGTSSDNPQAVAESFFSALETKDFEGAKKLATENSAGMLDLIQGFMQEENQDINNRFNVVSVEENGDNATITFEAWNSENPDDKDTDTMDMVKVDGAWKVKVEKE
ncbi:MAG: DUF4878 domain-containing protein [Candidatus Syntrophosphaera sp.]|jgi:uncharacterized secreted protein with C-terminal beta-propeller domain